jgi:hypothetical protein
MFLLLAKYVDKYNSKSNIIISDLMITVDDITKVVFEGAQSDYNRWCAGVCLGHSSTSLEALTHFLSNGGYPWVLSVLGIQDRNYRG